MAKYSFEFKMKVVRAYIDGEGGYGYLANKFNIPANRSIENWVANYRKFGEEGLLRKRKNKKYTLDFKLKVVEYYLTEEISYQDLAMKLGINNPSLITTWVSKFREQGVEGLSKVKGRPPNMKPKEGKGEVIEKTDANISEPERIKELEEQVRHLQIENMYLKELRRLRLGETRKTKK